MLRIAEARACLALASFHEILGVLGGARVFGPLQSGLISDLMSFHEQGMENLALILRLHKQPICPSLIMQDLTEYGMGFWYCTLIYKEYRGHRKTSVFLRRRHGVSGSR